MATLTKFTFLLRDFRSVSCQWQKLNLINKLHIHSIPAAGSSCTLTLKAWNNHNGSHIPLNLFLGQPPKLQIHTSWSYLNDKKPANTEAELEEPPKKLTLFQRFKAMYRDYWYVLVPVHVVTSAFWFGGFYYAAKSGIDIVAFVEKLHLSETIVEKIRSSGHSTAGYVAISYALYKIFTPLRYTVTLGGTTVSINYLRKWGYIKPIPKKEELKKMLTDQRHSLREKRLAFKDNMIKKLNQKKRWKKKR